MLGYVSPLWMLVDPLALMEESGHFCLFSGFVPDWLYTEILIIWFLLSLLLCSFCTLCYYMCFSKVVIFASSYIVVSLRDLEYISCHGFQQPEKDLSYKLPCHWFPWPRTTIYLEGWQLSNLSWTLCSKAMLLGCNEICNLLEHSHKMMTLDFREVNQDIY